MKDDDYDVFRFQPTLPVWGEKGPEFEKHDYKNFQPLSPCGRDDSRTDPPVRLKYFNPLSPCGERRTCFFHFRSVLYFQPTLPVWERQQNLLINHVQITFKLQQFVQKHQYKWSKYVLTQIFRQYQPTFLVRICRVFYVSFTSAPSKNTVQ